MLCFLQENTDLCLRFVTGSGQARIGPGGYSRTARTATLASTPRCWRTCSTSTRRQRLWLSRCNSATSLSLKVRTPLGTHGALPFEGKCSASHMQCSLMGKWGTYFPCASLGSPMCICWTNSTMQNTPMASPMRCLGPALASHGPWDLMTRCVTARGRFSAAPVVRQSSRLRPVPVRSHAAVLRRRLGKPRVGPELPALRATGTSNKRHFYLSLFLKADISRYTNLTYLAANLTVLG